MAELFDRAARWLGARFARAPAPPEGDRVTLTAPEAARLAAEQAGATVREDLGAALGAALAGTRTVAWASDLSLTEGLGLLRLAADRSAPLVVVAQAGGEGWQRAGDTGCVRLLAGTAQEALDLVALGLRLAETALVPVIVGLEPEPREAEALSVPEGMRAWCGAPGDAVPCPTEAQRLLFGPVRRRLVRWHDLERPRLLGTALSPAVRARRLAAREALWLRELPELFEELAEGWRALSGRGPGAVEAVTTAGATLVIVAAGAAAGVAREAADLLQAEGRAVGTVTLRALSPWPGVALASAVPPGARVVVLDRAEGPGLGAPPLLAATRAVLGAERPVRGLRPVGALRAEDLVLACRQQLSGITTGGWLGLGEPRAAHPRQQAWLDAVSRACPQVQDLGVRADGGGTPAAAPDGPTPLAVRLLTGADTTADALPAFHARVGSLQDPDDAPVDPALAVAAVPPLTATFARMAGARDALPSLAPEACTGCGACWSACPEGAISATTATPRVLVDTALARAIAAGTELGALRRLAGTTARALGRAVRGRTTDHALPSAGALVGELLAGAALRAGLAPQLAAASARAAEAVGTPLAGLPLVATAPLFDEPEQRKAGTGELLTFAVDPELCTGCGACGAACEPDALGLVPQTPDLLAAARQARAALETLPEAPAATLGGLAGHPDVGPLGALLLSQRASAVWGGGAGFDPGSGPRLALRIALAAAEHVLQPRLAEVQSLAEALGRALTSELIEALPTGDLVALGGALAGGDGSVAEVLARVEHAGGAQRLGAGRMSRLRRLTALQGRCEALSTRLVEAGGGLGRARLGVVLGTGAAAALGVRFPFNPLQAPALVAPRSGLTALVQGLMAGQLRQAAEDLALVRQARRELDDPALAARSAPVPPPPWSELSDDERALCPPLLLVVAGEAPPLTPVWTNGLPLRVLALAEPDGDGAAELQAIAAGAAGALVAQESLACGDALATSWLSAWAHPGPSLHRVHAPSPAADGLPTEGALAAARAALDDGGWARLRVEPLREGLLSERVELLSDGGPAVLQALFGRQGPSVEEQLAERDRAHAAERAALEQAHDAALERQRQDLEAGLVGRLEQRLLALAGYAPADPRA